MCIRDLRPALGGVAVSRARCSALPLPPPCACACAWATLSSICCESERGLRERSPTREPPLKPRCAPMALASSPGGSKASVAPPPRHPPRSAQGPPPTPTPREPAPIPPSPLAFTRGHPRPRPWPEGASHGVRGAVSAGRLARRTLRPRSAAPREGGCLPDADGILQDARARALAGAIGDPTSIDRRAIRRAGFIV